MTCSPDWFGLAGWTSDREWTFTPVTGAPALLLLSTADNGTRVGVTNEGAVFVSADDGTT